MFPKIPRKLLVFLVLFIGVLALFVLRKPHSVCDNQLQLLRETQAGFLYPRTVKTSIRPPLFPRLIDNCKAGNSPGACYELFSNLRKFLRDLASAPQECLVAFGEEEAIKKALAQPIEIIAMLAWGAKPPEPGPDKLSWLETLDIALFCQLKATYLKAFGRENWEDFRGQILARLPGEAQIFQEGQCLNCENRKKAKEVLADDQIWTRSLFSLRCEDYN